MQSFPKFKRPSPLENRRSGFTLVELALVMALAAILMAAIWMAAGMVSNRTKVNNAVQELRDITQNMLTLYEGRGLPAALPACPTEITGSVIAAGVVPVGNVVSAATCLVSHPWTAAGGDLKIFPKPAINGFRVSFYNVPLEACMDMLMQATACDPSQAGCPVKVSTDNGAKSLTPAGTPQNWQSVLTPTIAASGTLCGANAAPHSGGPNSVEFDFKL